ncbi:MAG TPA: hypothetical protein VJW55_20040, partial [Candidatus Angelobacter sp.]|nr:hypothetical protein [Candidatus Angelobacter sp.]
MRPDAGSHFLGVLLSSLFIFLALFALIGTLMVVLPESLFRRISLYLRVGIVMLLLGLLCSTFVVPQLLRTLSSDAHPVLHWLPPVWFLGLLRTVLGKADASMARLGTLGWQAMVCVSILAPAAYIASYYRYFIRIPETLGTTLRNRAPKTLLPMAWMDHFVLRSSFERSIYRFTMKTLLRNARHSLLFGAFSGLGLVLALQMLASAINGDHGASGLPQAELLSVPFVLAYFVICGLRFVFDIPAELNANWIHRVILHKEKNQSAALARKVMLTFILPWALLVCLPLFVRAWGWAIGTGHVAVLLAACALLAQLLLRRFSKIPFACTYTAWKQSSTMMILLFLLGFWAFAFLLPDLEHSSLRQTPFSLWVLSAIMMLASAALRRLWKAENEDEALVFEEGDDSPFELL